MFFDVGAPRATMGCRIPGTNNRVPLRPTRYRRENPRARRMILVVLALLFYHADLCREVGTTHAVYLVPAARHEQQMALDVGTSDWNEVVGQVSILVVYGTPAPC